MDKALSCVRFRMEEGKILAILAVFLTAISLLPIWLIKFPPLHDYPYHLLRVYIIANYFSPSSPYDEVFTVSLFPLPYILVDYLLLMFTRLFDLQVAGKILLSIYVIILPWSVFFLIRSVDKGKTLLGFFSFLFIYNYHFNMGYLSFIFSIPFFLFAVGYWWQIKDRPTWKRQLILSGLILCVYLAHLYTYAFLLCTFTLLAIFSLRDVRKVLQALIPLLPSLLLLVGTFAYLGLDQAGSSQASALFYPSLPKKIWLLLTHFVSFLPFRERIIFFITAVVVLALFMLNVKNLKRNAFFGLLLMLTLLYLLLPAHITPIFDVANRLIVFIVFMGLLVLAVPKTPLFRRGLLLTVTGLSVFYIWGTLRDYQLINQGLSDYYAAIEQIPAGQKVSFAADKKFLPVNHISPFVFFRGYYYMRTGGGLPIGGFSGRMGGPASHGDGIIVGDLRPIRYKEPHLCDYTGNIARFLADKEIDPGGYAVVVTPGGVNPQIASLTNRYGYKAVLSVGNITFYRREHVSTSTNSPGETISVDESRDAGVNQEYDYLLLYQDVVSLDPAIAANYESVFSQGNAHLFRRIEPNQETNHQKQVLLK